MKTKIYFSAIIFLFIAGIAAAQVTKPKPPPARPQPKAKPAEQRIGNWNLSLGLQAGIPQDEFREQTDAIPFGGGFMLGYVWNTPVPIGLGAELNFMGFGSKTERKTLTAEIKVGDQVIDHINIPLRFTISNTIFDPQIYLRIFAPAKIIVPFAGGFVGMNSLTTNTKVYDDSEQGYFSKDGNNLIVDKKISGDIALSYGGSFGLLFQIGKRSHVYVRGDYVLGHEAYYFTSEDIRHWEIEFTGDASAYEEENLSGEDLDIHAVPKYSRTDMITINAGLYFNFGRK